MSVTENKSVPVVLLKQVSAGRDINISVGTPPTEGSQKISATYLPVKVSNFFMAREDLISNLRNELTQKATVALVGMPGVGKTQIAARYASMYKGDYSAVLWATADSDRSLCQSLAELVDVLELPEKHEPTQNIRENAVRKWLQKNSNWLLILDNLSHESLNTISEFETSLENHILITTLAGCTEPFAWEIAIHEFNQDDSLNFLLARSNRVKDSLVTTELYAAQKLCMQFQGLPLALDQAGAYLRQTSSSFTDYLTSYIDFLAERGSAARGNHPDSVTTTIHLALKRILTENSESIRVLKTCAFLYPDFIPEEIFNEVIHNFDKAYSVLHNYSLLKRFPDRKSLSLHRLTQTIIVNSLSKVELNQEAQEIIDRLDITLSPQSNIHFEDWERCERLLPCVRHISKWIEDNRLQIQTRSSGHLFHETGFYLSEHGEYEEAISFLRRAFKTRRYTNGSKHLDTIETINQIGVVYQGQGRISRAKKFYKCGLKLEQEILNRQDSNLTARLFNNLGVLCDREGNDRLSLFYYKRALSIRFKLLGHNHHDIAFSLQNIAYVYLKKSKYGKAESLFTQALRILENNYEKQVHNIAQVLDNISRLFESQGEYAKAKPFRERLLTTYEYIASKYPHRKHIINTAVARKQLGDIHYEQGCYDEAEELYKRSLPMVAKYGEQSITAQVLNNLAKLYHKTQRYHEAKSLYERSLEILSELYSSDHPHILKVQENYEMNKNLLNKL